MQRAITVRGHTCSGLLLFEDVRLANYYSPQMYLHRTITVRKCTCSGPLLSADVPAADKNNRVQVRHRTITVRGRSAVILKQLLF